ncbi:hypothetical protein SKAU_G00314840 [Synaphobranchus kaupii]|uniref:Protein FAM169B n=1 Tax=Synaphobranchus kaupii TaxID=118154 RepID=A0A9Q1ILQ5_SYNKA|nr:hypothetical protein SKAU_G00314840 [Synaphobranchus kaupii]
METLSKGVQLAEENYPVDTVFLDYNTVKKSADDFMTCLGTNRTNNPPEDNWFVLPSGDKVKVSHNNIVRLSLFGDGDPMHTILALYEPTRETHVIALYLNGKWWPVCNILKTSNTSRSGLVTVRSVGERVVLFLLSQVIFGVLERPPDGDTYFAPHPEKEFAKIVWQDGEAAGFYTVKRKGTLCDGCSGLSYLLPVLDTVFVRTQFRRRGLALRMLEDFCVSHGKEEFIGISRPVSSGMYQVCRKYLQAQERDRERLYEVEAPGGWTQRRNVWLSVQLSRCSENADSSLEKNLSEVESESIGTSGKAEKGPDVPNAASVDTAAHKARRNPRRCRTRPTAEEEESGNSKQSRVLN